MTRLVSRFSAWLTERPWRADAFAVLVLTVLWVLFFWRVITPNPANQLTFPEGDYTGQFLAFGAYQAERLTAGEIPLWNPYNYGGHPFLADTQAAVFYPPRLVSIFVSEWFFGGWGYSALQAETIAHFWLASVLMYAFLRMVTGRSLPGLIAGLTIAYGGYLTGYPPLQLAVLEAGIWLPLGLLGVHQATRTGRLRTRWLALAALAMGLSLLAGHPQTSLFFSYVLLAYVIHRVGRFGVLPTAGSAAAVFAIGYGLAMIQLLPAAEYTRLTTRTGLGFEALANGFPFADLLTAVLPGALTVWSPLYMGIVGLLLAAAALLARRTDAGFFGVTGLVGLLLSFGGATLLYQIAYLLVPGFAWFRGQERAAFIVAHSVAVLAGLGTAALLEDDVAERLQPVLRAAVPVAWIGAVQLFIVDRAVEADLFTVQNAAMFTALVLSLAWLLLGRGRAMLPRVVWAPLLVALVAFDLFSATMNTNLEPIPLAERDLLTDLVPVAGADEGLYRVDGRVGLFENYGTLVGLQDIRGTSPLRLQATDAYLTLPEARLHQLTAVEYVFTDFTDLTVPSTILATDESRGFPMYLHRLESPLPRAWMVYQVMDTPNEAQALGWIADPSFDPRQRVTLPAQPPLDLPEEAPSWEVEVLSYAPEIIRLRVETPTDGVLLLSEWDYPGWQATVDGEPIEVWRGNAGQRALPLEAGTYEVTFSYRPASFMIGAVVSGLALVGLVACATIRLDAAHRYTQSGSEGDT